MPAKTRKEIRKGILQIFPQFLLEDGCTFAGDPDIYIDSNWSLFLNYDIIEIYEKDFLTYGKEKIVNKFVNNIKFDHSSISIRIFHRRKFLALPNGGRQSRLLDLKIDPSLIVLKEDRTKYNRSENIIGSPYVILEQDPTIPVFIGSLLCIDTLRIKEIRLTSYAFGIKR